MFLLEELGFNTWIWNYHCCSHSLFDEM